MIRAFRIVAVASDGSDDPAAAYLDCIFSGAEIAAALTGYVSGQPLPDDVAQAVAGPIVEALAALPPRSDGGAP